jgi:hypothetical protein
VCWPLDTGPKLSKRNIKRHLARHGVHPQAAEAERLALTAVDESLRGRPAALPGPVEEVSELLVGDEAEELLEGARESELGQLLAGRRGDEAGGEEFAALPVNALPELLHGLRDQLVSSFVNGERGGEVGAEIEPSEAVTRICRRLYQMRITKGIPADHILQIMLAISQEVDPILAHAGVAPPAWPRYWREVDKRYRFDLFHYRFVFV